MNPQDDLISATEQAHVIQSLKARLMAYYVYPNMAEIICTCLQKHLDDGDYLEILDGELFALALTLHMQEVNHDEHLWIRWHAEPSPGQEEQLRHNQEWQNKQRLEASLDNYGFHRVERLSGNVGYLDIHYFHRPGWGGETAVAAMNFLSNTNALIIDLRQCKGGYLGMIALICSFLFGEEPVQLENVFWRDDNITQQYWTLPFVPGKRLTDKPVYVLTSKITFSGGEDFAYILQTRHRAILLGEKTDGGAHPGASYRIHPHFDAFIPVGRVINPVTGTDWEGIGVTPDFLMPPEQAFTTAYQMALQSIIASLGDPPAGPYELLKQEAQSTLRGLS